ncbi:hypothetical protein DINM_003465 [Dirofilaria immitis]|nr:hypothetical protein [Dirofilaria immitis]
MAGWIDDLIMRVKAEKKKGEANQIKTSVISNRTDYATARHSHPRRSIYVSSQPQDMHTHAETPQPGVRRLDVLSNLQCEDYWHRANSLPRISETSSSHQDFEKLYVTCQFHMPSSRCPGKDRRRLDIIIQQLMNIQLISKTAYVARFSNRR